VLDGRCGRLRSAWLGSTISARSALKPWHWI
jgi:hypothetical protein